MRGKVSAKTDTPSAGPKQYCPQRGTITHLVQTRALTAPPLGADVLRPWGSSWEEHMDRHELAALKTERLEVQRAAKIEVFIKKNPQFPPRVRN